MKRTFSLILALVLTLTMFSAFIAKAEANNTTCEHQFEIAKSTTTHYEACTLCGLIQSTQVHTFEMCTSAVAHYNACSVCGYIKDSHKHLFENGACTVCGYADELVAHKCPIVRATEGYHRFECDECENYTRVNHDETSMSINAKNEFFHSYECADCGYAYTARHDFRTGHDENLGHYEKCVDCGYKTATVAHVMTDDFFSHCHDIECEECNYNVARHIGVNYTPVDQYTCLATCSECDASAYVDHEWSSFVCDNCGYKLDGYTVGMITDIKYFADEYDIYLLTATGREEVVTMSDWRMWDVEEGDVIRIDHYGNTIWGIDVLVDCDVLDDVDNFENYVSPYISEKDAGLVFDDLLAYRIEYYDEGIDISFNEALRIMSINTDYVVFDIMEGDICDLEEDCAYLTYFTEEMAYFICIW